MDRNFHTDDFERLLREKSDEFRMYPSKRIWHSIYNNIHPGRKWPSVAMSITLITSLFLVGYLNTKNTNSYALADQGKVETGINTNIPAPLYIAQKLDAARVTTKAPLYLNETALANRPGTQHQNIVIDQTTTQKTTNTSSVKLSNNFRPRIYTQGKTVTITAAAVTEATNELLTASNSGAPKTADNITGDAVDGTINTSTKQSFITSQENIAAELLPYANNSNFNEIKQPIITNHFQVAAIEAGTTTSTLPDEKATAFNDNKVKSNTIPVVSEEERTWIENYAMYNRPAAKKWANKLAVQMYATPSVVYRILLNEPGFSTTQNATPFAITPASNDINSEVIQTPSYGFEVGTGLQYYLVKGIKLKGGLQLNYTRYNAHAFQNTHPVVTKLTMYDTKLNSAYEVYRATPYSNKSGLEATKLHNVTMQLSLPIGADFKLAGNDMLQWNVGVTIQPTYVIAGKSYLISSDRRNYVKENSMLNKWNMNAGFETFITYKINGLTWQVGPQFRSQLFSTNSRKFAVEEKLLNYGIKFGVSKTLK